MLTLEFLSLFLSHVPFLFTCRSIPPEMFLEKCVLKICRTFTAEHQCRSDISVKLLRKLIEITLRHGCSERLLLHFLSPSVWWRIMDHLLLSDFMPLISFYTPQETSEN